ncbi:MAG: hypothetical protein AB8E82_00190 [Aureispira sp.]
MQASFLNFLQELRFETVHLSYQWHQVEADECRSALEYLHQCYQEEQLNYPHEAPAFDPDAALWGALLLYYAAQAILNRQATLEEITPLFAAYRGSKTTAAVLSVDLSLRFLPNLLEKLKTINPDDGLIVLLEQQLAQWPYSAIGYTIAAPALPTQKIQHPCLHQLYADRIIAKKASQLLPVPWIQQAVRASLGAHQSSVWPDLELFNTST